MVSTARNTIIDQKPNVADVLEADRPGEQERHLEVEDDEQDRHQVEAHVELHPRVVEGVEAALVGRDLLRVGIAHRHHRRRRAGTPARGRWRGRGRSGPEGTRAAARSTPPSLRSRPAGRLPGHGATHSEAYLPQRTRSTRRGSPQASVARYPRACKGLRRLKQPADRGDTRAAQPRPCPGIEARHAARPALVLSRPRPARPGPARARLPRRRAPPGRAPEALAPRNLAPAPPV